MHRHAIDFDSDYRREEAIASTGGKNALFNAVQVLVDHGDEVILPVPYWVSFKDIVRYAGGECVLLHSDEVAGLPGYGGDGCGADHAADESHHFEFAFESFGRGDEREGS